MNQVNFLIDCLWECKIKTVEMAQFLSAQSSRRELSYQVRFFTSLQKRLKSQIENRSFLIDFLWEIKNVENCMG